MPEQTAVERTFAEAKAEAAAPTRDDPLRVLKITLVCLLALATMYTLYFAQDVLLPIFLAFLLSLLLRPAVKGLRRLYVPEPLGAALVMLATLGLVAAGVTALADPAVSWMERAPTLMQELRVKLADVQQSLEQARAATEQISDMASDNADAAPEVVVKGPSFAESILSQTQIVVAQAAVTVALTFFFLAFGRHTLESVMQSMPRVGDRLHLADIVNTVQINITTYLVTVTAINLALGLVAAAILWAVGMPNPLLWGMLAGLLNFIPYLGSAATTGILAVVALLSFDTWWEIAAPPLAFVCLTMLEGNFVTPFIVGRRLTLNPIFVFATVLFWGWLWGIPGALLAVPILAAFKILCDATPPLRTLGALIGG